MDTRKRLSIKAFLDLLRFKFYCLVDAPQLKRASWTAGLSVIRNNILASYVTRFPKARCNSVSRQLTADDRTKYQNPTRKAFTPTSPIGEPPSTSHAARYRYSANAS